MCIRIIRTTGSKMFILGGKLSVLLSVLGLAEPRHTYYYGTLEGTFLFQYLPEKKMKQNELEKKSKQ